MTPSNQKETVPLIFKNFENIGMFVKEVCDRHKIESKQRLVASCNDYTVLNVQTLKHGDVVHLKPMPEALPAFVKRASEFKVNIE